MKRFFIFLFFIQFTILQTHAQTISYKTKDSERIAKKLRLEDDYVDDLFVIYESNTTFNFELDDETGVPYAIEETEITILSLLDYTKYQGAVYTDLNTELLSIQLIDKNKKRYSLNYVSGSYQNSGIFHQDGEYNVIELPSSTFGEVMKYRFVRKHNDLKYLTSHYFQSHRYYINNGEVTLNIPEWLDAEILDKNLKNLKLKKDIDEPKKSSKSKGKKKEEALTVYKYSFKELDPAPNEVNMPGPSHVLPHIVFLFKGINKVGVQTSLLREPIDLYSWYKSLVDSVENDSLELYPIYESIVENASTKYQKLKAIFYWLQGNIRYIAFEDGIAGFMPASAHSVCKKRYGDCKGMANLAKELYKMAGFDARLTWIGTKRIAYDYTLPNLAVDNHVICTIIEGDKKYFLDITEDYIAIDDYAERIQGRPVMIENGDSFLIDTIPVADSKTNMVKLVKGFTISGDKIVGKAYEEFNGESKTDVLRSYNSISSNNQEEALEKFLNNNDKNYSIKNIKKPDLNERSKPLVFEYEYTLEHAILTFNQQYFIPLDYEKNFYSFDFDNDRVTDYLFNAKYFKVIANTFFVPKGWEVVHLPVGFEAENEDYSIKVQIVQEGDQVKYVREINIFKGVIQKKNQLKWNQDLKKLREVYDDFMVIGKIN